MLVELQAPENMGNKMKEKSKSAGRKIMSNAINFCNEDTDVRELLVSLNRTYKRTSRTEGSGLYITRRVKRATEIYRHDMYTIQLLCVSLCLYSSCET
jgi:hypothetical protein